MIVPALIVSVLAGSGWWWLEARSAEQPSPTAPASSQVPAGRSEAEMLRARAAFERDRDAVVRRRLITRGDVDRTIGRRPDSCTNAAGNESCLWIYETQPEKNDVIAFTFRDGGVLVSSY